MTKINFHATCASKPDDPYDLVLEVERGTKLTAFLKTLAKRDRYVSTYIFNLLEGRMYPYHLLIVEEKILLPRELDGYVIDSDTLNIVVKPFVSGG